MSKFTSHSYPVSIYVPAGNVLTIRNGGAVVIQQQREASSLGEPFQPWNIPAGGFKEYGAYPDARTYRVDGSAGTLSYEINAA